MFVYNEGIKCIKEEHQRAQVRVADVCFRSRLFPGFSAVVSGVVPGYDRVFVRHIRQRDFLKH